MNVVVIGKPRLDVRLPVEEYTQNNTNTEVLEKVEEIGGNSAYVAIMLVKYGIKVYYQGVVGEDDAGNKFKQTLESYGVDTKYIETNYEGKTSINYGFYKKTTGENTNTLYNSNLKPTKYKYDFIPDYIITDGADLDLSIAASNNYPNAKMITLANKVCNEVYSICKRSSYVVSSEHFAEVLSKMQFNYKKGKTLVDLFQKVKDLNKAEYIMNLTGHGTLYVNNRQVKYIPSIEYKLVDNYYMDASFFGMYAYCLINSIDADTTAKLCNTITYLTGEKVGSVNNIIPIKDVYEKIGIPYKDNTKEVVEELDV